MCSTASLIIPANAGAALHLFGQTRPDYGEIQEALNDIKSESHRASELFDGIRALFGRDDQEKQPVDLNEVILDVIRSMQGQLKEHKVAVSCELMPAAPIIPGHSAQLREVMYNLINNAIEAMELTTDRKRMLNVRTDLRDRDTVTVSVDSNPRIQIARRTTRAQFRPFEIMRTNSDIKMI